MFEEDWTEIQHDYMFLTEVEAERLEEEEKKAAAKADAEEEMSVFRLF